MIRRPPRSTLDRSSAASDVYKRQEIKTVEKCKYLGGVFGREGGNVQEVISRIAQYGGAVRAVNPILKDRLMSVEVKRVIFEGVLTPILLYGTETWSTTTR